MLEGLIAAYVCFIVGGSVYDCSQDSRFVDNFDLPMGLTSSSISSLSANYPIVVPILLPVFDYEYLHLSLSAAGSASQRTAMLGSCLQAHHSIINRVMDWC